VVVSLLLGTSVTLLASVVAAIRATRVPPILAVRQGSVLLPPRLARYTPYAALILTAGARADYVVTAAEATSPLPSGVTDAVDGYAGVSVV
jgi:hypothetical protein